MTKITIEPDCGQAPKKELLRDFNVAFAKGDSAFTAQCVSDDIRWTIHGDRLLEGKARFSDYMNTMKNYVVEEMTLHSVIVDDDQGAVAGKMKMNGIAYAFCDMYTFSPSEDTIREIRSYAIEIK